MSFWLLNLLAEYFADCCSCMLARCLQIARNKNCGLNFFYNFVVCHNYATHSGCQQEPVVMLFILLVLGM